MLPESEMDGRLREVQIKEHFEFKDIRPECTDEYIKIPVDLPWEELAKDVPKAFQKFGWHGLVGKKKSKWERSILYGGLGLTYNPTMKYGLPKHAHGLGMPRALEAYNGKDTYQDCMGLRERTNVTRFRSFESIANKVEPFTMIQGRIAEIRAELATAESWERFKDFVWHTDEDARIVSRILIPLIFNDDFYIEFDTGTKIYFEPGYAYHWDTLRKHKWSFDYHENIKNRTCVVLGISPWISYSQGIWHENEYCNKIHPTDMIKQGMII